MEQHLPTPPRRLQLILLSVLLMFAAARSSPSYGRPPPPVTTLTDERDVCRPGVCGPNAQCRVHRGVALCSCLTDYFGNPFEGCTRVPANQPPKDPVKTNSCYPSPCGDNAECISKQDDRAVAICRCLPGYTGSPHQGCTESKLTDERDVCRPGVCGPNAQCRVHRGVALCSCLTDYFGNPFEGCTRVPANQPPKDPVKTNSCYPSPCGDNAECISKQDDRAVAICRCLPGYTGSPHQGCTESKPPCQYGFAFIDQCENQCLCNFGGGYTCTEKGCIGGTPGEPMKCEVEGEIRSTGGWRLFCKRGIVRIESSDPTRPCTSGLAWQEDCNTCSCSSTGRVLCTLLACSTTDQGPLHCQGKADCHSGAPVLGVGHGAGSASGGGGVQQPDIAVKNYCDGPCAADCGELLDESRQCYKCQCLPELQFGDAVVAVEEPCPAGLSEGPTLFATKICRGQGCKPGVEWRVFHDGCSRCVCTEDREPACTPCQRGPSPSTVTCDGGRERCPQDCGQKYNPIKDCYDCPCGVGEPGDVKVPFSQPCPPGTDFRSSGAFFKACGPIDTLPKGDTKICDTLDCPADCGTVRISTKENCAYCQCGPELAPGDEVVPIDEQCPPNKLPGPTQLVTKVCRAPTREECKPETTYNLECNICLCQKDGIPACTLRDCSLPKYGDVQVCDSQYRECPADCGTASSDSYCQHCQCGPRLEEGDITIPIDQDCPPGFIHKENQFATKTCSPAPGGGSKRYCDGSCAADCGEVLDSVRGCYTCQCGPELQFGDVVVAADSPCPEGLTEGQRLFATKVCRAQGCRPGSKWRIHHDGCSRCVCTEDGEPACTPCQRVPSPSTLTCESGAMECPQDCGGKKYNPGKDCFECDCGVGEEGDVHVDFSEPCPSGTDFRESGAFFKACGPIETLPKGDTKICDTLECPADCGTVRISTQENCAYCQCGPKLAPGDEEVPIDQKCRSPLLEGPRHFVSKVCRAPTREECKAGTTYNLKCDICLCQEDGVPACTNRNCSLPKYGDVQVCDSQYRGCPADCGTASSDSYCQHCQCGPRLEEGDITIPIDQNCPPGFIHKENQFVTKTCSPAPDGGPKQYCDGPCAANCEEALDSSGCYRCECTLKLEFGDVMVPVSSPCPEGLAEGQRLSTNKVCRGEGCRPGAEWRIHQDGCSRCICTKDGEVACTPCQRGPTDLTRTCEDGVRHCPDDCGMVYNAGRDCLDCPCGVGEPGDIHVDFDEPCPPGTDFREAGAFFMACGPIDTLPKGDTKICDTLDCPADCGIVRISTKENCAYCQCGPKLAPGDEVVPIDEQCPPNKLPGPTQLVTKVCLAPTRDECIPGMEYNVNCDICLCQENGVPACTLRNCGLPKFGNLLVCDGQYSKCPAHCASTGADSYCRYCQCAGDQPGGGVLPPTGGYQPPTRQPTSSSEEEDQEEPSRPSWYRGSSSEEDSSSEEERY